MTAKYAIGAPDAMAKTTPRKISQNGIKISAKKTDSRISKSRRLWRSERGSGRVGKCDPRWRLASTGSSAKFAVLRSCNPTNVRNLVASKALTPFGLRISKRYVVYTRLSR